MKNRAGQEVTIQLVAETLKSDIPMWLRTWGHCMLPVVPHNVKVKVEPLGRRGPSFGDIIVYQRGDRLVAHRVITKRRRRGRTELMTKADQRLSFGSLVDERHVIGKIVNVETNNGTIDLERNIWRIANLIVGAYSLLISLTLLRIRNLRNIVVVKRRNRPINLGSTDKLLLCLIPRLILRVFKYFSNIKTVDDLQKLV